MMQHFSLSHKQSKPAPSRFQKSSSIMIPSSEQDHDPKKRARSRSQEASKITIPSSEHHHDAKNDPKKRATKKNRWRPIGAHTGHTITQHTALRTAFRLGQAGGMGLHVPHTYPAASTHIGPNTVSIKRMRFVSVEVMCLDERVMHMKATGNTTNP
jgi:hypothetical protein